MRRKWIPGAAAWWPAFLLALLAKALQYVALCLEHGPAADGQWAVYGGDAFSYIEPIESLLAGRGYEPDLRMPGYGVPYLLLRLFLNAPAAQLALVLSHVVASAAAVVVLARLAHALTGRDTAFHITYWTGLVAIHANFHDRNLLTESYSVFAVVLAIHQVVLYLKGPAVRHLWIAGCAMTWLVFMKPVFLPAFGILAFGVLWHWKNSLVKGILHASLLCLPFLVAETAWVTRNALVHGDFRPLSEGVFYPDIRASIRFPIIKLMQTYGLSFIWWDGTSEIRWFNVRIGADGGPDLADRQKPLPAYIYTAACPKDTLDLIATDVLLFDAATDTLERARKKAAITERCERCAEAFKTERPFDHHVTARANLLRKFLVHTGTPSLTHKAWPELDLPHRGIKLFYVVMYLGIMIPGTLLAAIALLRKRTIFPMRMVAAIHLYAVLIFPLVMRMCEPRYTCVLYPLALLFTTLASAACVDRWRDRKARHLADL